MPSLPSLPLTNSKMYVPNIYWLFNKSWPILDSLGTLERYKVQLSISNHFNNQKKKKSSPLRCHFRSLLISAHLYYLTLHLQSWFHRVSILCYYYSFFLLLSNVGILYSGSSKKPYYSLNMSWYGWRKRNPDFAHKKKMRCVA